MQGLLNVTDAMLQSERPHEKGVVLIDFWAEWCAPCKAMAPVLAELSRGYEGRVSIIKVNADENPWSSEKFGVRGLPTLIVLRDGVEAERATGLMSKSRLASMLERHLEV